jgi:hypothetical protein
MSTIDVATSQAKAATRPAPTVRQASAGCVVAVLAPV